MMSNAHSTLRGMLLPDRPLLDSAPSFAADDNVWASIDLPSNLSVGSLHEEAIRIDIARQVRHVCDGPS